MKNYLLVDFEFTTYNRPVGRPSAYFSEIIEIGAVLFDGESFKELAREKYTRIGDEERASRIIWIVLGSKRVF